MSKVLIIYLLTLVANTIDVLSYCICIVGVKTKKIAVSNALFQVVMIISRVAVFLQAPLLGSIADKTIINGNIKDLEMIFRNVIFMTTIGSLSGGIFTPMFIRFFSSLTNYFERMGTIPKMLWGILVNIGRLPTKKVTFKDYKKVKNICFKDMPHGLIILNSIAISIYSVGLLSSIYAGVLEPDYTITTNQLSGIVVGGAAALFMLFIDPMVAVITDQTLQQKMSSEYIKSLVFFLVISDFIGTMISQIIFIPLAHIILFLAKCL